MAENRDPRIDPHVGDTIYRTFKTALDGGIIREVTRAHGGFVFFLHDNGYTAKRRLVSIHQWRQWAEKAEVGDLGSGEDGK